jgi:hypothetical protein
MRLSDLQCYGMQRLMRDQGQQNKMGSKLYIQTSQNFKGDFFGQLH